MRGGVNKFSGFLINVDEGKRERERMIEDCIKLGT